MSVSQNMRIEYDLCNHVTFTHQSQAVDVSLIDAGSAAGVTNYMNNGLPWSGTSMLTNCTCASLLWQVNRPAGKIGQLQFSRHAQVCLLAKKTKLEECNPFIVVIHQYEKGSNVNVELRKQSESWWLQTCMIIIDVPTKKTCGTKQKKKTAV